MNAIPHSFRRGNIKNSIVILAVILVAGIATSTESPQEKLAANDKTKADLLNNKYLKFEDVSKEDWDQVASTVHGIDLDEPNGPQLADNLFRNYVIQCLEDLREGEPLVIKYTGGVTAGPIPGLPTPVNPEPNKWFEPDLQSKVNPLILVEAKAVMVLDNRGKQQLLAFVDYVAQSTPKGIVFVVTTSDVSFADNPGTAVVAAANAVTKKVPLYQSFAQVKSKCEKGKWLFEFRVNTADKLGTTAAATSPLGSPSPVVKIEKR